ncbi:MAG: alanine racemase [bacterium]|nr:alanine racemase [bacterium]
MTIHDLDTPALTIDLDILEKNIRETQEDCNKHNIQLRVHTKTHKIPEIAKMQLAAGAVGIVCQKVGEAEAMVAGGISDILIPYNIVGPLKVKRLTDLCKRAALTVAVDSEITARGLSAGATDNGVTLAILVECDTGGERCGVQSPEAALALARKVCEMPGLQFKGIMTFPSSERAGPFLDQTRALFSKADIPLPIISGGGTGTAEISRAIGCTETRIGSHVFEGLRRISHLKNPPNPISCAQRMIVTVVSTPVPERIIIDGGQKTFASHPPTPYGHIVEHPKAKIYAMSVEHGHVDVSQCNHTFTVGDRLSVIPLHQGMTTNLHDEVYAVRKAHVEHVWTVAGRGKVR